MNESVPAHPSPHPIWQALLSPARSVEVRAWLTRPENAQHALSWRGPRGETMLHWGAMSDLGLMVDLLGIGLDPNALDGSGRSPVDWLCERLWMTHMEGVGDLTRLSLKKLRVMTDDLLSALWRQGGRPADELAHVGALAVQTGLWQTLETLRDLNGNAYFLDWPQGTALHVWPKAPAEQGRDDFLSAWIKEGMGVDLVDGEGKTPLFVAVQERLRPEISSRQSLDLDAAIDALLERGANPNAETSSGESALSVLLTSGAPAVLVEHLGGRLESAVKHEGGLSL